MEKEVLINEEEPPSQPYPILESMPGPGVLPPGETFPPLTSLAPHEGLFKTDSVVQKLWPGVTTEEWNDWRWQMANRVRTIDNLSLLLNLKPYQISRYKRLIEYFHFAITPYYLSLIDWSNPDDPVRKQSVPDLKELEFQIIGDNDPLEEEEDMQVAGLVHRYPDRVLAVVTNTCSMYCRHCTRKRIWHEGESERSKKELKAMVDYIRSTSGVREVVVSGGDPLTMNIDLLDWFLGELQRISHIEVLRIGTRVPAVLPMRITDDLVSMLSRHRPLWLNTQFNHPREITPEVQEACDKIQRAGIPISNQSVLLRGVNDSLEVMKELCHALQRIMVRPYYLYQCDPVRGVEHFRTNLWKGIEIIEMMRGYTGGLCVPTFVVDAPGGGGKIPLQPFYLLSVSEKDVILRNYEGMIIKYFNPQESDFGRPKKANGNGKDGGTAQLIKGTVKALVPEETVRYKRRKQKNLLFKAKDDRV
ncbi:MAG: KamA family radical SAM protein [bacterium]